jgi:O-antigen/teichoic acid export membrane protein
MTPPESSRRLARNAISNWGAFLVVAGVSFFLSPFVVHRLGNTAYGVWTLLVSVIGYLGLLDFGVRGAVTTYIARHQAAGEHQKSSSLASAALLLFSGLGAVAVTVAAVLSALLPLLFDLPAAEIGNARMVLMVGGLTVATTLIGAVFGGIITGLERFDISSGLEIGITVLRATLVIVFLRAGYGLVALALIHLAIAALHGAVLYVVARRLVPQLQFNFRQPLRPQLRTIVSFSMILSAIHLTGVIIYYTDAVVIAAMLPISAVTYFAIAGNLADYGAKVAGALSKTITPRVSAQLARVGASIEADIIATARVTALATGAISATFWLRGESFISLWMGAEYGPLSGRVLSVLAIIVCLAGGRAIAASAIIGANQHRRLLPILIGEAVCNLLLSIVLVRSMGVVGVALGSAIPSVVVGLWFMPRCLAKSTTVSAGRYYRDAMLRPLLACVPFALASFAMEQLLPASNLFYIILQIAALLPLVPLGAFYVCLSAADRSTIWQSLCRRVRPART